MARDQDGPLTDLIAIGWHTHHVASLTTIGSIVDLVDDLDVPDVRSSDVGSDGACYRARGGEVDNKGVVGPKVNL